MQLIPVLGQIHQELYVKNCTEEGLRINLRVAATQEDTIANMLRFVILLGFFSVSAGHRNNNSQSTYSEETMFYGGSDTVISQYPYQVRITTFLFGGVKYCGGSIINPNFVLTAAHCVNHNVSKSIVRAGSSYRDSGGTLHNVTEKVIHEMFDENTRSHDVAVLRVSPSFKFSNAVRPAVLPEQNSKVPTDASAVITGWGHTDMFGVKSKKLQKVRVKIFLRNKCKDIWLPFASIQAHMICAVYPASKSGACIGDSGGPLLIGREHVGILTFGEKGCTLKNIPDVYTRVSAFRDWIDKQTSNTEE